MTINPRALSGIHATALVMNRIFDGEAKRETTDFVNRLDRLAAQVL